MKHRILCFGVVSILLMLISCGYYDNPRVIITNFSPTQPIAIKLPTHEWFVIYPGETSNVPIPASENTLLIAFAKADDSGAFFRAAKTGYEWQCCYRYEDEYVDPPDARVKFFSFNSKIESSFWNNVVGEEIVEIQIVAEEIGALSTSKIASDSGISSIRFRVIK